VTDDMPDQWWDTDQGPEHPDLQHEQPPVEATDDPADFEPDDSEESAPGELPEEIPDAPDEPGRVV